MKTFTLLAAAGLALMLSGCTTTTETSTTTTTQRSATTGASTVSEMTSGADRGPLSGGGYGGSMGSGPR